MSYSDYLLHRGYTRITVERTAKQPGDLVLSSVNAPLERVEGPSKVVRMRKVAGA